MSKILVIKHGALGDVVLATAPMKAIREHHKNSHITLLTTKPYADMLKASGYFDEIWIDERPRLTQPFKFYRLIKKIHQSHFTRIYDLQTSERTSWYFKLLPKPKPEWVGTAKGVSHPHDTPHRTTLHTVERHKEQLAKAGIYNLPKPDIDWLTSDISRFKLPERYALIVAGGSAHRTGKRWPAANYGTLSAWMVEQGITPVLLGTKAEATVLFTNESLCPQAINLLGQTSFADIATLARGAVFAVGNDTGPMHLVAVAGCPSMVLFSGLSDPALCAPRGPSVTVLREEKLVDLRPKVVIQSLQRFLNA